MGLTAFGVLVLEIAAEIAAPHQNEGPHLAAGLRARRSADRSGARGKPTCQPGREPMRRDDPQDPEMAPLRGGSAPIPRTAIVCGEGLPVKTSLRRAPHRRGLDRKPLPAKAHIPVKGEWELLDGPPKSATAACLPLVGSESLGGAISF